MRKFQTFYYVNVTTTHISGIYYDETKYKFFGLSKQQEYIRHLELEIDWVEDNFHEEFLDLVRQKSKKDR